ncbi:MAG: hypothetical protein RSB55_03840 [Oscillospiraceae bacterium]
MGSVSSIKRRYAFYIIAVVLLAVGIAAGVLLAGRSGAWLTNEGDWQDLAGDYRIGVIDYTVELNNETLIAQVGGVPKDYSMLVPLQGAVRIFDPTVGDLTREREFNEGATLMRVRIINRSDSLIEIGGTLRIEQTATGNGSIRFLTLPETLDLAGAKTLNRRKYVLDTLNIADKSAGETEQAALQRLNTAYGDNRTGAFIPRTIFGTTAIKPTDRDTIKDPNAEKYYSYTDCLAIVWTEYDTGAYNKDETRPSPAVTPAPSPVIENRMGRFFLTVHVGQLN